LERAAQQRGVPIAWPVQALSPAQAGDRAASAGAAAGVLVGSGAGAPLNWTFAHAGQSAKAQGGVAVGIDLAADTLAARYAPASTRDLVVQSVRVGGVTDLAAYAGLLAYLRSLSMVRQVMVEEVSGDTIRLLISLRGDLGLLRRIAGLDAHLVAGAQPGGEDSGAGTDFTWQP
jgi:hypothetical protein